MMEKVYSRPSGIFEGAVTGFCPGCMHSSVCKVVAEVLDELGMVDLAYAPPFAGVWDAVHIAANAAK